MIQKMKVVAGRLETAALQYLLNQVYQSIQMEFVQLDKKYTQIIQVKMMKKELTKFLMMKKIMMALYILKTQKFVIWICPMRIKKKERVLMMKIYK
jgi:hypothetical protein